MTELIPRTVSVLQSEGDARPAHKSPSLASFRSDHGYILLGEAGQGKTEAFKLEASLTGGVFVPARRLVRGDLRDSTLEGPLFIDGLDEIRAGVSDPRVPLDSLINQVRWLGNPPFRVSCRLGSWLGSSDSEELSVLTGYKSEPTLLLQLNPLSADESACLLTCKGVERGRAERFVQQAAGRGLNVFLDNPQLMHLLYLAVKANGWPQDARSTFELACGILAREINPERQPANLLQDQPAFKDTLDIAGKLSALLLISGAESWTLMDSNDPHVLSVRELTGSDSAAALRSVLNSGLFSGTAESRHPTHRLLAEFLGASYLSRRIGAPSNSSMRRLLSLLVGPDGQSLVDLQGLVGWLATLNPACRHVLMRTDPVAVALHGDASRFRPEELGEFFADLGSAIGTRQLWPVPSRLGALTHGDQRTAFWKLIAEPERDDNRQHLVFLLLSGVKHNYESSPNGASKSKVRRDEAALLNIVRDATWDEEVRIRALATLGCVLHGTPQRPKVLVDLLGFIASGPAAFARNQLLGTLLGLLYPSELPIATVWDHQSISPTQFEYGEFQSFWTQLVEKTSAEQVRELLNSLCERAAEIQPRLALHRVDKVVFRLLARGLELFGDQMSVPDIIRWFSLVEMDFEHHRLVAAQRGNTSRIGILSEYENDIRAWLKARKPVQLKLIEHALLAGKADIGRKMLAVTVGLKFVGTEPPDGFRQWCADRARDLFADHSEVAKELASWTIREQDGWGPPLTREAIANCFGRTPPLRSWLLRSLESRALHNEQQEHQRSQYRRHAQATQRARLAALQKRKAELAAGRCEPYLLHELAESYMDGRTSRTPPIAQLTERLGNDQELVQAALSGFMSLAGRDELPDLDQVVALYENNRLSLYILPYLAGLEYAADCATDQVFDSLDHKNRLRALGYFFLSGLPTTRSQPMGTIGFAEDARPAWFRHALNVDPNMVADALIAVHRARVRTKEPPDWHLFDFCGQPDYQGVRALAIQQMVSVYPTRCTSVQTESLRLVLWAALRELDTCAAFLGQAVRDRLARGGMDLAQRALWLSTGLFVAREFALPKLADFLSEGDEIRVGHVIGFMQSDDPQLPAVLPVTDWPSDELATLVRVLGRRVGRPGRQRTAGFLSHSQAARLKLAPLLESWLTVLARRSDDGSQKALDLLRVDPELSAWHRSIEQAAARQAGLRQAAAYTAPSVQQIQETLAGGTVAGSADLAAVIHDALDQLSERIRTGHTNDWRQYWHCDPDTGQPQKPRHENDCRDALLSDLQLLLPPELDARAEGQYADNARADIRVTYGSSCSVPVEIKRSVSSDVWRAASEQLNAKYTGESEGNGIYFVFWFGPEQISIPPSGHKPQSASEMNDQLQKLLAAASLPRIRVVVIDVSPSAK